MPKYISLFELFSVGIGPSSSHSVGPMKAVKSFVDLLVSEDRLEQTSAIQIELYGSLALTGKGHGTDKAIVLGLLGLTPETVDPDRVDHQVGQVTEAQSIELHGRVIPFDLEKDILFNRKEVLPFHANGMVCRMLDSSNQPVREKTYYSVGGGFVIDHDDIASQQNSSDIVIPFPFESAAELLAHTDKERCAISRIIWENEKCLRSDEEIREKILYLWAVMQQCVERGCKQTGTLPGGLKVERRAAGLLKSLESKYETRSEDPLNVLDWVDLFALAVNEENAAGGRVVTAPTNGAAGIIPAVLHYYDRFCPGANEDGIIKFFLTAGAIAKLYKKNASISGAEVGCQGEVGVACSMAAAALTEVMGGTPHQVEEAAEIGMEHNLGLTCDPIGGLVQVPCIERNAMGAVKAINASRLALRGDGQHRVSLDKVIATMRRTGEDMSSKYKETSRGGLALHTLGVNVTEC